jgi:hypothetical protein
LKRARSKLMVVEAFILDTPVGMLADLV